MVGFCLLPQHADKFIEALKSGEINPGKLVDMTSEERNTFLGKFVGKENATAVNATFESKMILKNQNEGMVTWAKRVAGLKPDIRRDLISRISKLDKVLDPEDKKAFMKDLASTKLGVNVTQKEAKTIADLSKKVESLKESMSSGGNRLAFGRAKVELSNYVNDLKVRAGRISLAEVKQNPLGSAGKLTTSIASNSKAITSSMDNSAIFRQGWKTLWTHPGIWQRNARQSFVDLVRQFGGKQVMDEVNADIVSRPTYDKMVRAKLAVGSLEEAFPTTLPEKIPILGRAYKATEAAYTAFVHRQRADVFDKYLQIAEKSGVNTSNKVQLEAIGKLVNSLTGRGYLGRLEPVANTINSVFFSPRFLKSNFDTLTMHASDKMTPFARKQAAINLVKIISGTAVILAVARSLEPNSVELDPRSSDFGKIKIGDTRFDVTGGMSSIVTLATRLARQSSKSTATGQINPLNSGKFGSQTELDTVTNFFENKLSPAASIVKDLLKGQDAQGKVPTPGGEIKGAFTPIGIQNYQELKDNPRSADTVLSMIADSLGISSNTYAPSQTDWGQNPSKQLQAFKQAVGSNKFEQANKEYNMQLSEFLDKARKNSDYQNAPSDKQDKVLTREKTIIKNTVLRKYIQ